MSSVSENGGDQVLALGVPLDFLRGIWSLNHALERTSSRMMRTLGVTAPQRLIVRCVGKYPGLTAGQLASLLHLDRGTISSTLRRLENKHLITRRRDSRDRRRVIIGLTAAGRALDQPEEHTVESAMTRLVATSDPADVEAAKRVLEALTSLLAANDT